MANATINTLVRYSGSDTNVSLRTEEIPARLAVRWIASDRQAAAHVHVYEVTDRDGNHLHVANVQHGPRWERTDDVTDIFVIPSAALADL